MSDTETVEDKKRARSSSDSDAGVKDEPMQARLRTKKNRPSNIYSSSEEDVSDDEKSKKSKLKKKLASKKTARASSEDDVEEGEVSDEGSFDEMKYDDGFDDQLMGDDADKERLGLMTEREREEEIFRRLEHRQALERRAELEKKLRRRATESGKSKSLTKAVDETSARSKERRLMVEGKKDVKSKVFESLKAEREEKRKKAAAEQEKKNAEKLSKKKKKSDSSSGSDDDEEKLDDVERKKVSSSSDSDSDDSSRKSDEKAEKDASKEPIDTFEQLEKMRLSRHKLVIWMYHPFFAETAKGCFVRVNFGDMEKGAPVYRIAEIVGVGEGTKLYKVTEGNPPRTQETNTVVHLRVVDRLGDREKQLPLTFVSNSAVDSKEFEEFKKRMESREISLPNRGQYERKLRDLERAKNYHMTDEDITNMVDKKKRFHSRPQNYALRKAELVKEKQSAELRNDPEEVHRIQQEINEINAQTEEKDKPRLESQVRIGAINQRNKSLTLRALEDAMNNQQRRESERGTDDPFTRRWGTPTLVHKKGAAGALVPGGAKDPPDSAAAGANANSSGLGASASTPAGKAADPFNMHNFDIDIDINLESLPSVTLPFGRRK